MSFDLGNSMGMVIESSKSCRPDYEKQAAQFKKQLTEVSAFKKAILKFYESCDTYRFSKISSFAELIGGLVITEKEMTMGYTEALKKVEK